MKNLDYNIEQCDNVVVLGAGPSLNKYIREIKKFVAENKCVVIGCNYNYPIYSDYTMFIGGSIYADRFRDIRSPNIIVTPKVIIKKSHFVETDSGHSYYLMQTDADQNDRYWDQPTISVTDSGVFHHWLQNCGFTALLASHFFKPKKVIGVGLDGPTKSGDKMVLEHFNNITRDARGFHAKPKIINRKHEFLNKIFDFLRERNITVVTFDGDSLWNLRKK